MTAPILDQRDAFCAALYPAVQPLVPDFNRRAGCSIWTLRVDQQLILKRILVVPGCRPQKIGPALGMIRNCMGRAGGKFGYSN
nr:hypothetical protein [Paenibacillus timonensis]